MIIRYNQKLEPLRRIFDSDILFNRPDSNEIIRFCYKLQDSVSKTVAKFTKNQKSDWNRKVNQNGVNRWLPDFKPFLQPNTKLWKIANPNWFRLSVLELNFNYWNSVSFVTWITARFFTGLSPPTRVVRLVYYRLFQPISRKICISIKK